MGRGKNGEKRKVTIFWVQGGKRTRKSIIIGGKGVKIETFFRTHNYFGH